MDVGAHEQRGPGLAREGVVGAGEEHEPAGYEDDEEEGGEGGEEAADAAVPEESEGEGPAREVREDDRGDEEAGAWRKWRA